MKHCLLFVLLLLPFLGVSQIHKHGYNDLQWGHPSAKIKNIKNCNAKFSGNEFANCDIISKDSLFLNKYKFLFCNARFYKDNLAEIQVDISHSDLAALISQLTKDFGSPTIREKKHQALDKENQSTGYTWTVGDTQIFVINDGIRVPAICVLSSINIRKTYPANTLTIDKLIFE
jgi:hypothetical protein